MSVSATMRRVRWRRRLARVRDVFPLTASGLLLLVLGGVVVAQVGVPKLDLVLLVMGAVAIVLPLLALMMSGVAWVVVHRAFLDRSPGRALEGECGRGLETDFTLPPTWWLPLVAIHWSWESPRAEVELIRKRGKQIERVIPQRRTVSDEVTRLFEIRDVFGLVRWSLRRTERRHVRIFPATGGLERVRVVQGMAGGQDLSHPDGTPTGDRIDIRPYNPGDPIRLVLWKVFAKTRELVVRTPERAISPIQRTVAYLVTGDEDEAAAGAARSAVQEGALGQDWAFAADGIREVARDELEAMDVLARSGAHAPLGGSGLDAFLGDPDGGGLSRALVFVPPNPGPWLDRVIAAAAESDVPMEFIVALDGVETKPKRSRIRELLTRDSQPRASRVSEDELRVTLNRLAETRYPVTVVDRIGGVVVSAARYMGRRS